MRLATFMIGPEAGGRGYRVLAASGIDRRSGWAGNVPLALLGWAKLRIATPFSGRFPVAGGAIMLRARYVEEGSSGPIAYANGVFIAAEDLVRACNNERAILNAIPLSGTFGDGPLDIADEAFSQPVTVLWEGLGLAWQDRQIFVDDKHDLDDVALKALESVTPAAQRVRIRGWCTTALLGANGDFLPIMNCNLLATPASERLAHERFLPCRINADGDFASVPEPASYQLWKRLVKDARPLLSAASNTALAQAWMPEMTSWPPAALAWHLLETVSRQGESFATMVDAIGLIGESAGDGVGADMVGRFLTAMAQQAPGVLAGLFTSFEQRLATLPESRHALFAFRLWSTDDGFAQDQDEEQMLLLVRTMARDVAGMADNAERNGLARHRVGLLEDRAHALSGQRHDYELRSTIALIRKWLGDLPGVGAAPPSRQQAHRLWHLRTTLPLRQT